MSNANNQLSKEEQEKKAQNERAIFDKILAESNYSRSAGEAAKDTWTSTKQGVASAVQSAIGILNLPTQGRMGKAIQKDVIDLQKVQEDLQKKKSATAKMQARGFENADGFFEKLGYIGNNPMMAVDTTVQSLPSMFASGGVGRGVGKVGGINNQTARAAIGEGLMMAGSQAENLRTQNEDGLMTGKDIAASVGTGVGGAAIGGVGGMLSKRMGAGDIDSILAGGVNNAARMGGTNSLVQGAKGLGKGFASEGAEELAQSVLETGAENWARGNELTENMAGNAALGLASGGLMGGAMGAYTGAKDAKANRLQQEADELQSDEQANRDRIRGIIERHEAGFANGTIAEVLSDKEAAKYANRGFHQGADESIYHFDENGNIVEGDKAWTDNPNRMISDNTDEGYQGNLGLLGMKQSPILTEDIDLGNGRVIKKDDPLAYSKWLAEEQDWARKNRARMQEQAQQANPNKEPKDVTPIPTDAVVYGIADALEQTMYVSPTGEVMGEKGFNDTDPNRPISEESKAIAKAFIDMMLAKRVDVHAVAADPNARQAIADFIKNKEASTWTDDETDSFIKWLVDSGQIASEEHAGNQRLLPAPNETLYGNSHNGELMSQNQFNGYNDNAKAWGSGNIGGNIVDKTPVPVKSGAFGLDPSNGTLSRAGALAVDSGASPITDSQRLLPPPNTPPNDTWYSSRDGLMSQNQFNEYNDNAKAWGSGNIGGNIVDKTPVPVKSGAFGLENNSLSKRMRLDPSNGENHGAKGIKSAFDGVVIDGVAKEVQAQEAQAPVRYALGNQGEVTADDKGMPVVHGKANYIQNKGERLNTQIMVVEADSLNATKDLDSNQARNRNSTSSRLQIDNIVKNLDPQQLSDSTTMTHGSPTITESGKIVAGNGRTLAIQEAYNKGLADEYRKMLVDKAGEYGLDANALAGMKKPVLVKNIGNVSGKQLRELALNSNETGTAQMSAYENALADSERVNKLNLSALDIDDNGAIKPTNHNKGIINGFISQFPIEMQNAMRDVHGMLSKEGLERFENAMLLSAYGNSETIRNIIENADPEQRNIIKALIGASTNIAKAKQGIEKGVTDDADIAQELMEALAVLAQLRKQGVLVSDYLAQQGLFEDALNDTGKSLLAFMDKHVRHVSKIRQLLNTYYDTLLSDDLSQNDMFGRQSMTKQQRLIQTLKELGYDPTEFTGKQSTASKPTNTTEPTGTITEPTRPTGEADVVNAGREQSQGDVDSPTESAEQAVEQPKTKPSKAENLAKIKAANQAKKADEQAEATTVNEDKATDEVADDTPQEQDTDTATKSDSDDAYGLWASHENWLGSFDLDSKADIAKLKRIVDQFADIPVDNLKNGDEIPNGAIAHLRYADEDGEFYVIRKPRSMDEAQPSFTVVQFIEQPDGSHAPFVSQVLVSKLYGLDKDFTPTPISELMAKYGTNNTNNQEEQDNGHNGRSRAKDLPKQVLEREPTNEHTADDGGRDVRGVHRADSEQDLQGNPRNDEADVAITRDGGKSSLGGADGNLSRGEGLGSEGRNGRNGGISQQSVAERESEATEAKAKESKPKAEPKPKTAKEAIDDAINESNPSQANFVLSEDMLGKDTKAEQRLQTNLDAIDLVKDLRETGRVATAEEKALLARYTGFGGLSWAFTPLENHKGKRLELVQRLKETLSREEFREAAISSQTAYFTPPSVINTMWDVATRLGFNGGVVLEPSVGVGSFVGFMPQGLPSHVVATEIDPITATIAKQLYPQATIYNHGYEKLRVVDNSVDLAIGNPPYGSMSLSFDNKKHLNKMPIADQFMIATLEQLRPNGISIMVVSSNVMDKDNNKARLLMAQQAELVNAVRLPNNIFKDAGTEVVTDILVFKKHSAETLNKFKDGDFTNPSWVHSSTKEIEGKQFNFNPYFDDKTIGEPIASSNMYGDIYTVNGKEVDTDKALQNFVNSFEQTQSKKSIEQIQEEIANTQQAIAELDKMDKKQLGDMFFDDKGNLHEVVMMDDKLGMRTLSPQTIWHSDFKIDENGGYYKEEDVIVNGKKVKEGNGNKKERVYYEVNSDKIKASQRLGVKGFDILKRALHINDLLTEQFRIEGRDDVSDKDIEAHRKQIKKAYDDFTKKHGLLNHHENIIGRNVYGYKVLGLEKDFKKGVKEVADEYKLSDILSKRVVHPYIMPKANNATEALSISLAHTGVVDVDFMSSLLGKDGDSIIKQLTEGDKPLVYFDPAEQRHVSASQYLAGNVRRKIIEAKEANLFDNVQALQEIVPKDKTLEQINISLGMRWLPIEIYKDFVNHVAKSESADVVFNEITGYSVAVSNNNFELKTIGIELDKLLENVLNQKPVVIRKDGVNAGGKKTKVIDEVATANVQQVIVEIKRSFSEWIYEQEEVTQGLTALYNEIYNSNVKEIYDGSHLDFPTQVDNRVIELRTHQKNAVWRGITTNAVLYNHAVGSGKTFTGIARAIERKRMGLSNKPMIVVPNHMVEQFAKDAEKLYPTANIKAAGKNDFDPKKRKRLYAEIANNDYDLVIVPMSSFGMIKMSKQAQELYINEQLDELEYALEEAQQAKGKTTARAITALKNRIKKEKQRLDKLAKKTAEEQTLTFEQMGIDDLTIDEAHMYKNLFYNTQMQGVKGLNTPEGSGQAFDLYMKTQHLHNTGGSMAFMTGTPISNSAAEMHTFMRYLMPQQLKDKGLHMFDTWAIMFADNTMKFEATESGSLKQVTRFARKWKNMPALMMDWHTITDTVTNEDVKADYKAKTGEEFPLPRVRNNRREPITVAADKDTEHLMSLLVAGHNEIQHGNMFDKEEKMKRRLQLLSFAQKMALDPRVVDPIRFKDSEGGKLSAVTDKAYEIYEQWKDEQGTQIIFLDRSIPGNHGAEGKKLLKAYNELLSEIDKVNENTALSDDDREEAVNKLYDKLEKFDMDEIASVQNAENGGWNAYDEIKKQLVAKGVKAEEIAFIHSANSDKAKDALFDKVNAGNVRIILGSTPRMGAGTNIQKRLVALHHVDVTWKPSDVEQRDGRIIRQGNELYEKLGHDNFEVEIYTYVTEGSFDAKQWDTITAKLGTINAIHTYKEGDELDTGDDEALANTAMIAALASGDPRRIKRAELDAEVSELQVENDVHNKKQGQLRNSLKNAKVLLERLPQEIEDFKETKKTVEPLIDKALSSVVAPSITIDGKVFTGDNAKAKAMVHVEGKKKKADEKGERATFVFDGKDNVSFTDVSAAINKSFKEVVPMAVRYNGKDYDNIPDVINEHSNALLGRVDDGDGSSLMTVYGLDVVSDFVLGNKYEMSIQTHKGRTLVKTALDHNPTGLKLINAIEKMVKALNAKPFDSDISNKQKLLSRQSEIVKDAEAKIGQDFEKAKELAEKTQQLAKLNEELATEEVDLSSAEHGFAIDELIGILDKKRHSRGYATAGISREAVQSILAKRFGGRITQLVKQGKLKIVQSVDELPFDDTLDNGTQIQGVYHNGVSYLVADNLNDYQVIGTFLHEHVGHGTFQQTMPKAAYDEFMREFERLVAKGDGIATQAKYLASFNARTAEEMQDEYIPYLLTLASERQEQAGWFKSMVNRITLAVKSKLRKMGFNIAITAQDILAMAETIAKTEDGNPTPPSGKRWLSQSAMKSIKENISRGTKAMNQAILNKADVNRAMYRNDIGWIDFVYGDVGTVKTNGKTKGAMGISHIIEARMRKDGMSRQEVVKMLTHDMVETIARGEVYKHIRFATGKEQVRLIYNGYQANLVKNAGSNAWLLTGYELHQDDVNGVGVDTSATTHTKPTRTRHDVGASDDNSIVANQNSDVKYQRGRPVQAQITGIQNQLAQMLSNPIGSIKDLFNNLDIDHYDKKLALLNGMQIAELFGDKIPAIRRYINMVNRMDADTNEKAARADKLVKKWGLLEKEDATLLADVMHTATLQGIDPSLPFVEGDNQAHYDALKDKYDKLSTKAQQVFEQARDDYIQHKDDVYNSIKERISRSSIDKPRRAELIDNLEKTFFHGQKVYFPLARFGKYVITVKDSNGNVVAVSREETPAKANLTRQRLMKLYPNDTVGRVILEKKYNPAQEAVSRGFMSDLFDEVNNLNIDDAAKADFKDTLGQLYLSSLPDVSFAKAGMHRKGTAGFSEDARRAYAHHMTHGGNYLAKMRYADRLEMLLEAMQEYVTEQGENDPDFEQNKMQKVVDEMNDRHQHVINPQSHPLSTFLTSIGFVFQLGLSPAAAMINLSQTWLVGLPIMGAKWGAAKTAAELAKASAEIKGTTSFSHNGSFKPWEWDLDLAAHAKNIYNHSEYQALERAYKEGLIDKTLAHDLAGVAQGEDNHMAEMLKPMMTMSSALFHHAEVFNRQSTFIAAYRMAKQAGESDTSAYATAKDMTWKSHFNYANSNRARVMQGPVMKVVTLFKQYSQNMVYTMLRNTMVASPAVKKVIKNAFFGANEKVTAEEKQAAKTMALLLSLHAGAAGTLGLPMSDFIFGLATAIVGATGDDEPWDAEVAYRNKLTEMFGANGSEIIAKGIPRAIGLDLSGRVGLNDLVIPRTQDGLEGARRADNMIVSGLGPVAGLGVNMIRGTEDLSKGELLDAGKKMTPKFLGDYLKAYELASKGVVDKRTQIDVFEQEKVNPWHLIQQASGFRPGAVAQAQEVKSAKYQQNQAYSRNISALRNEYIIAKMGGDDRKAEAVWQEIKEFNSKNPSIAITRISLMRAIKQRQRKIKEADDGMYLPDSRKFINDRVTFGG